MLPAGLYSSLDLPSEFCLYICIQITMSCFEEKYFQEIESNGYWESMGWGQAEGEEAEVRL